MGKDEELEHCGCWIQFLAVGVENLGDNTRVCYQWFGLWVEDFGENTRC